MRNILRQKLPLILILAMSLGASTAVAQTMQPGVSRVQVRTAANRVRVGAVNLQSEINRERYDDTANNADNRVSTQLSNITRAADNIRRSTTYRNSSTNITADLNALMDASNRINLTLSRNATSVSVNSRWDVLKADISTLSGYYGMTSDWNNGNTNTVQTPRLNTSGARVRAVLNQLRNQSTSLRRELERDRYDDTTNDADGRVSDNLEEMIDSINDLSRSTFSYSNVDDAEKVNDILERSSRINRILARNRTGVRVDRSWSTLKRNIDTLASYYGVTANWTNTVPNNNTGWNNNRSDALTGTYRLNVSQSENVATVIDRSLGYYATGERENIRRNLERRLASPELIAIDKRGNSITLASSNQSQVMFDADGVARTETDARGRQVTTRVTSTSNDFTIDYSGNRVNDFNVMFDVDRSGRLRVTRKIYLENRNETVSVASVYDRISTVAEWNRVPVTNINSGVLNTGTSNNFYIPNGVTLNATLRNMLSTRDSQVGDRFTMDVTSPSQYRGAVIEGRLTQTADSGRVSGRANMQLDLDSVSFNGQTYRFAGIIQSATAANGDSINVNNEGTIRDSSQTTKTATRAGIGAVLGAIIGAIADGGSGAAIGAGVGAGAGAGTVLLGGKDNIELGVGSTFTILSSAPNNSGTVRQY